MSRIIIGIGSGRCGTISLSKMLNNLKDSQFTHECLPTLTWKFNSKIINDKLEQFKNYKGKYIGDVAFYYIKYVEYILNLNKEVKFICLCRGKKEVVESFYQIWSKKGGIIDPVWKKALPSYMWRCDKASLSKYWDEYYKIAEYLKKRFPENFEIFSTNEILNTHAGMEKAFDFIEISEEDRNFNLSIKENKSEYGKNRDNEKTKLRILCIHDKELYDKNMDRTFFHGYESIEKHVDVESFIYSGKGWKNYDVNKTVSENIKSIYGDKQKPNVILAVQYYLYKGMSDVNILKVSRADETYKEIQNAQALQKNKIDLVIFHHLNGMLSLQKRPEVRGILFENIPRLVNTEIFKDYKSEKIYDLLLVGCLNGKFYPFRNRLKNIIESQWSRKFKCKILIHPGYKNVSYEDKDEIMRKFSKEINRAKVVLTCSSKFKYALSKYFEVPRSMSLLAADLPDERHKFFREYMLVLNPKDSDAMLERKVKFFINNDEEREKLIKKGYELVGRERNQEVYANSFVFKIQSVLESRR